VVILDSLFYSKSNVILRKLLDYSSLNHKVIANNIANVETPGFTAKKVAFRDAFQDAVRSGDLSRIRDIEPRIVDNLENPYRMDMNNVDIEKEMLALEENRMRYELVGTLLKKRLAKWRSVFEGVKD
jgi:flagellar basal-body rod protein FlgB